MTLRLNQRGNLLLYYLVLLIAVVVVSMIVLAVFPEARLVMSIILSFSIYMNVRGSIGDGLPTLLITAILIYFLVFKYFYLSASFTIITIIFMYTGVSLFTWTARYLFWKAE